MEGIVGSGRGKIINIEHYKMNMLAWRQVGNTRKLFAACWKIIMKGQCSRAPDAVIMHCPN